MPRTATAISVPILVALAIAPAGAGTLDQRRCEWAFDLNYTSESGGGSATDLRFAWGYLAGSGYSEFGLSGTYHRIEETDTGYLDSDFSMSIIGPFYTWNWTPRSEHATGFLTVGAGAVAGDLSDVYDFSLQGALGMKLFVGNSAAVTAQYFAYSLDSNENYGASDHFSGFAIGIAIYTNRKHAAAPPPASSPAP